MAALQRSLCKGYQQPSIHSKPSGRPITDLAHGGHTTRPADWGWTQTSESFDLLVALVFTAWLKTKARGHWDPSFLKPHLAGPRLER